jgi:hypothetical protein
MMKQLSKRLAMATERWILLSLVAATMLALTGCNGGSTFNVQNPPPPPPSDLCVSFTATCPATPATYSLLVNATLSLTATVTNDPSNAGVDWALTCNNAGNCGTLSAPHTASGTAVTYTPPAGLSGNSQPVSIVAYATANHATNALAAITVSAFGNNLQGPYVLQAQGVDNGGATDYQFAGVIVLDGNGNITSGEQTVNFFDQNLGALVSKADIITGGSYFLGGDGRGTLTVDTADDDIGGNGIETFTFVFLSTSQALIAQGDFQTSGNICIACTGASASGTMDLQTWTPSSPPLSGGYAFATSGSDFSGMIPTGLGGVLNVDSSNNIVTAGSVMDQVMPGTQSAAPAVQTAKPSGTVSYGDPLGLALGAVTFNLNVNFPALPAQIQFTGYQVDGTHIKLIESDNLAGLGYASTAGLAISQGSATGNFSSFAGTYVFHVPGTDLYSGNIFPSTFTSVGILNASAGNGFTDTSFQQNADNEQFTTGTQISATFDEVTNFVDADGKVSTTFKGFDPAPKQSFQSRFFFYLTGSGPALVLADGNAIYPFLGAGIAYPQSTALTFPDPSYGALYGFNYIQQNGGEFDATAELNANPIAPPPCSTTGPTTSGTFSGCADVSQPGLAVTGQSFSGTFPSPYASDCTTSVPGCFTGTFSNGSSSTAFTSGLQDSNGNGTLAADFYLIDPDHGFFVETDLAAQSAVGASQVTLGYFAARCPVTLPPTTCSTSQPGYKGARASRK